MHNGVEMSMNDESLSFALDCSPRIAETQVTRRPGTTGHWAAVLVNSSDLVNSPTWAIFEPRGSRELTGQYLIVGGLRNPLASKAAVSGKFVGSSCEKWPTNHWPRPQKYRKLGKSSCRL